MRYPGVGHIERLLEACSPSAIVTSLMTEQNALMFNSASCLQFLSQTSHKTTKSTKRSADTSEQVRCFAPPSSLIAFLGHQNGWVRHHARECLVTIGKPAVPDLIEALRNKNEDIRWEAAKALGQIGDPRAAPALVKVLRDNNFGVRWLAAEGLIVMGHSALRPLLQALIEQPDVVWLGRVHTMCSRTWQRRVIFPNRWHQSWRQWRDLSLL